jgi:hypothetical protein
MHIAGKVGASNLEKYGSLTVVAIQKCVVNVVSTFL